MGNTVREKKKWEGKLRNINRNKKGNSGGRKRDKYGGQRSCREKELR